MGWLPGDLLLGDWFPGGPFRSWSFLAGSGVRVEAAGIVEVREVVKIEGDFDDRTLSGLAAQVEAGAGGVGALLHALDAVVAGGGEAGGRHLEAGAVVGDVEVEAVGVVGQG